MTICRSIFNGHLSLVECCVLLEKGAFEAVIARGVLILVFLAIDHELLALEAGRCYLLRCYVGNLICCCCITVRSN